MRRMIASTHLGCQEEERRQKAKGKRQKGKGKGGLAYTMRHEPPSRVGLLQGTLELLILRSLLAGPTHGHAIAKHIQRTSEDLLQVETGSLYPALHRLEAKGWIAASWELSEKGKRARFYRLTPLGRKQLVAERSRWETFSRAMALVLSPVDEEGR
jgi:PadR family transcriptional regulator PadR